MSDPHPYSRPQTRGELGDDDMEGRNGNDRYLFDTDVQLGNDTIREGSLTFYQENGHFSLNATMI